MAKSISELSLAIVGIGGYGNSYLKSLFDRPAQPILRIIGVVDPAPTTCLHLQEIHRRAIPIYKSLDALQEKHRSDLVVISSPLHLHCEQTVSALSNGSHVLCEKPLAGSPEQAAEMIRARDRAGKHVSIGYQWSFSPAIQALKRDIASGLFGRPRRLRTLVMWPRAEKYYTRNSWGGRRFSETGVPIFDSPLNNACAHHLHNMMYVLGSEADRSAVPQSVIAELYRVNDIETFDTAAVRVTTPDDVEVQCVVSHASRQGCGPLFTFEFEHATITLDGDQPTLETRNGASICASFNNGRKKDYGSPEQFPDRKLWAAVESAIHNTPTVCGIEAALSQTVLVAAIDESMPEVQEFPVQLKRIEEEKHGRRRWVEGLDDVLLRSYSTGRLPSELGVPWAAPGNEIHLAATGSAARASLQRLR